ncbi:MAG: TIM barrel protein, partial [Clostridia bacterium]|nr:TIM barrel protein [Clostridia bacterium]
ITIKPIEFTQDKQVLEQVKRYFGISCVDNFADLNYAIHNKVGAVELRLNASDWQPDYSLVPLIEEWKKQTKGYLSVHMPNLKYSDGEIKGEENWFKAIEYAVNIKADGLTIHPPKIKKAILSDELFDKLVGYYTAVVNAVNEDVKIGIENIHKTETEEIDESNMYGFGYTPIDVTRLINAINERVGYERVGFVLDVGHARNNGTLASTYPISRWFEIMGKQVVAYHIHQVTRDENGLKNHTPILDWLGPMISYASFFYAWKEDLINHCPVFLEVKGNKNYDLSIKAFESLLKKAR